MITRILNAVTRALCFHSHDLLVKVIDHRLHVECLACGAISPGIDTDILS